MFSIFTSDKELELRIPSLCRGLPWLQGGRVYISPLWFIVCYLLASLPKSKKPSTKSQRKCLISSICCIKNETSFELSKINAKISTHTLATQRLIHKNGFSYIYFLCLLPSFSWPHRHLLVQIPLPKSRGTTTLRNKTIKGADRHLSFFSAHVF